MALCVWLFECARCHRCVLICTRCLGGRRYCDPCGEQARVESLRASGRRYQQTDAGREKHRLRQQRWRSGQREGEANPAAAARNEGFAATAALPQGPAPEGSPADVTHQCVAGLGGHGAKLCRAPEAAAYVAVESGADGDGHEELHSIQTRAPAGTNAERAESGNPSGNGEPAVRAQQTAHDARVAVATVLAQLRGTRDARPVVAACSCCGRLGEVVAYEGRPRIIHGRIGRPEPG
jgi:hypothetical protein